MLKFRELLKQFRTREKLTQAKLADRLGVHHNTISDWERGKYQPQNLQMVLDLSQALELGQADVDKLLLAFEFHEKVTNTHKEEKTNVFVAREKELAQLDQLLENVLQTRQGCVAFITGEAGSGKTALVQEFLRLTLRSYPSIVAAGGNCSTYQGVGYFYLPFCEIIELLTYNMETRWGAEASIKKYAHRLQTLIPVTAQALLQAGPDLIGTFLSGPALLTRITAIQAEVNGLDVLKAKIAGHPSGWGPLSAQHQNLFEQYTQVLRILSRQNPLLLILDDLQWADNGSIELLFHLSKRLANCPILILGVYRSTDVAMGQYGDRHPLERVINELQFYFGHHPIDLNQTDSKQFIKAYLDSEPNQPNRLSAAFQEALLQHTGGHALFTTEMVRSMQQHRELCKDGNGYWIEGTELNWQRLPPKVEGLIRERIDRLPEDGSELKEVLKAASIAGEVFDAKVVAQTEGEDTLHMARLLSNVLDKQHHLVTLQGEQRYRFRCKLYQYYLYNSLAKHEKKILHKKIGSTLASFYDNTEAKAMDLARHFRKAGYYNAAASYLILAGERALHSCGSEKALIYFNNARTLLQNHLDTLKCEKNAIDQKCRLDLGRFVLDGHSIQDEEHTYTHSFDSCLSMLDADLIHSVLMRLWACHFVLAELTVAYEFGRRLSYLADNFRELADEPHLPYSKHAHRVIGATYTMIGVFTAAFEHCEQGAEMNRIRAGYASFDNHDEKDVIPDSIRNSIFFDNFHGSNCGVIYPAYAAIARWSLGFPEQALNISRESTDMAQELNTPSRSMFFASGMSSFFHHLRRETDIVCKRSFSIIEIAIEEELSVWLFAGKIMQGWALTQQRQTDAEISAMRQAIDDWCATGTKLFVPYFLLILAEAQAVAGQNEAGLTTLAEALAAAQKSGERWIEAEIYRMQGELLLAQGEKDADIEAKYRCALDVAITQKAKSWELRTVISLTRLRLRQGRQAEALPLLREVYEWFTEGFDTPDLKDANALLEEIA